MLRRIKFIVKTCWFHLRYRRIINELSIQFAALIAFIVLSYTVPIVLKPLVFKQRALKTYHKELTRAFLRSNLLTRPQQTKDTGESNSHTRYLPYVTDDITQFVINAHACPGSPPVQDNINFPKTSQQQIADKPITFLNLIFHRLKSNDYDSNVLNMTRKGEVGESTSSHRSGPPPRRHNASDHYDAVFVVCSNVKKSTNRDNFRQMYGNHSNTWPYRIKVVFLVGLPSTPEGLQNISKEATMFSDIVMGNFLDHYDNLTYKTVMGFRWLHTHCRNMDLFLKLDDDVFVDVYKFFDTFGSLIGKQTRTINCFVNKSPRVHRQGKYKVTKEQYRGKKYPPFCSGFFIVFTPDIVDSYVSLSKDIRFFRLEDVFSYGLLRRAMGDVQLIHQDTVTVESGEYFHCVQRYKLKCKYMGAQVSDNKLMPLMAKMAKHRSDLGMNGTDSRLYEP